MSKLPFIDLVPSSQKVAFETRVRAISRELGIRPEWLMFVMAFESGLQPSTINSIGAVGLIQFMPATAQGLGVTPNQLRVMTHLQQLEYVRKYYLPAKGKLKRFEDLYLYTFYPIAVGEPDSFVIGSERSPQWAATVARQNPALNPDGNSIITIGEWRKALRKHLEERIPEQMWKVFYGNTNWLKKWFPALAGLVFIVTLGFTLSKLK